MFIHPYKAGSQSVRNLREAMEGLRAIRLENSRFRGNEKKLVINWGCSKLPEEVMKAAVINRPEAVALAADKLKFFEAMPEEVNIPDFTADKDKARAWIEGATLSLLVRSLMGIVVKVLLSCPILLSGKTTTIAMPRFTSSMFLRRMNIVSM